MANFDGGLAFKSTRFKDSGKYQVIKMANLYNGKLDLIRNVSFINSLDSFEKKAEIKKDEILISLTGTTGKKDYGYTVHIDRERNLILNQRVGRIKTNSNSTSKYLYYFTKSKYFDDQFYELAKGGTGNQTNVSINDLKEIQIPFPPVHEQEAIAEALSDIDLWIESLEQLIAKKRLIKQGAMQELLTPKESWEVKRLGEVLQFGSGRDYKHLSSGNIPVYGTGGVMTFVDEYLYDGDSVGIGRKGTIDKPVFLKGKFWTVDTLFFTHSFKEATPKYLYYQFLLVAWKEYNEASGVPSLNKNTLEQIEIYIPSVSEQTRITLILTDMDTEIEALENKLKKVQQIKQGMMQELLTGRVRLVQII